MTLTSKIPFMRTSDPPRKNRKISGAQFQYSNIPGKFGHMMYS